MDLVGLIISGKTPTTPNTRCFQGDLPDAFALAVLHSICSIWALHSPDNATLRDLSATREALYPEKTRGKASPYCPKAGFPTALSPFQLLAEPVLRGLLLWWKLHAFHSQPPPMVVNTSCM